MERLEMVFDLAEEVNLLPIDQWGDDTEFEAVNQKLMSK